MMHWIHRHRLLVLFTFLTCWTGVGSVALAQEAPAGGAASMHGESMFQTWYVAGSYETWFLLTPMSIAVVALCIDYSINLRKDVLMPPPVIAQIETMFGDRDYRGAMEYTENEPSILSYVIHASLVEAGGGYSAMERAMNEAIKERIALLMAKVDICNIIGQLAPMVGLFGTVRAMIKAFGDMANPAHANMSPAQQAAEGLRTAMVKTFWGLFIGTIGLAVYSAFRLQLVRLGNILIHQAAEFVDTFKPGRQAAPRTQTATPQPQPARR